MGNIDKGIISSIEPTPVDRNEDPTTARVLPCTSPNMPTRPLTISWYLRGKMANLQVGDKVWFALSDDLSGIIFERADGEWSGTIPGDVTITGNQTTEGNTETSDVKTSSVASLNSHVHSNGHDGADTGAPTG